jgi:hypothetical protein
MSVLANREWRALMTPAMCDQIEGMGMVNVVANIKTTESLAVSRSRILVGSSVHSPAVNGRPVLTNRSMQIVSNTAPTSDFPHRFLSFVGQPGKVMWYTDFTVRIGKYTVPHALLHMARFTLRTNTRPPTSFQISNIVVSGVFKRSVNRASLVKDKQANRNHRFPGVTLNLRRYAGASKITPVIHTSKRSTFNISGCRTMADIVAGVTEMNSVVRHHMLPAP